MSLKACPGPIRIVVLYFSRIDYNLDMNYRNLYLLILTLIPAFAHGVCAEPYSFNQEKSKIAFELKHLGLTTADGEFGKFEGYYNYDPANIHATQVSLVIESKSVLSGNPMIPGLMTSEKFFWSEKFPQIVFTSLRTDPGPDGLFHIHGDLTIRGITHPAVFETEQIERESADGHLFFRTHTFISRRDYGIGVKNWLNPLMIAMQESLKITLEVEGIPIEGNEGIQ